MGSGRIRKIHETVSFITAAGSEMPEKKCALAKGTIVHVIISVVKPKLPFMTMGSSILSSTHPPAASFKRTNSRRRPVWFPWVPKRTWR